MTDFTITEYFPKNEIEFDARFSNPEACYNYLFQQKWPEGFSCVKCGNSKYWLIRKQLYICAECEHQHSLTAGTIIPRQKLKASIHFAYRKQRRRYILNHQTNLTKKGSSVS